MPKTSKKPTAQTVIADFSALSPELRRAAYYAATETMFNENHKEYLGIVSTTLAALPDTELLQVLPSRDIEFLLYGQSSKMSNLIDKYAAADDPEMNFIADALRALVSYPDTNLVKALFEREKLRTDLAHKSDFVDDLAAVNAAQRQKINRLQDEIKRLQDELKAAAKRKKNGRKTAQANGTKTDAK